MDNINLQLLPLPEKFTKNYKNKILNSNFDKLITLYKGLYIKDNKILSQQKLGFDLNFYEKLKQTNQQNIKVTINKTCQEKILKITQTDSLWFEKYLAEILRENSRISSIEILSVLLNPNLVVVVFDGEYNNPIKLSQILKNSNVKTEQASTILLLVFKKNVKVNLVFDLQIQDILFLNFVGFLEQNAEVILQNFISLEAKDIVFVCQRWFLEAAARLEQSANIISSGKFINTQNYLLNGAKAQVVNYNKLLLSKNARVSFFVNQIHRSIFTNSYAQVKSIAGDTSNLSSQGYIFIDKDGEESKAEQRHDVLLLSPHALVSAQPALEVKTKKVQCKHGSAIAKISDEQLWYLKSRGLNDLESKKFLLRAFLNLEDVALNHTIWLNTLDSIVNNVYRNEINET